MLFIIYTFSQSVPRPRMLYARGAGIVQWLERRTRDWKVAGSNPCGSGERIFFSRIDLLCSLLFRYPFHPRVTTVARKRSRSFCQKCRLQLNTHIPYVCGFAWNDMVDGGLLSCGYIARGYVCVTDLCRQIRVWSHVQWRHQYRHSSKICWEKKEYYERL